MSATIRNVASVLQLLVLVACLNFFQNVMFAKTQDLRDFFLCRKCGQEISQLSNIVNIPSKLALRQRNDTFGREQHVLIQLFKNPHGVTYEVITSKEASVFRASKQTSGDTWWPGYNWVILGCPRCQNHIGWEYILQDNLNSEPSSFYGLVLGNLVYENDADSLIVLPKTYNS